LYLAWQLGQTMIMPGQSYNRPPRAITIGLPTLE
jgi:hypothetical protein